jgi:glycosyl transferase family 87
MTRIATWWERRTPSQQRAIRDGLVVAGLIFNATLVIFWLPRMYLWIDATVWWHIDLGNLYRGMDDPGQVSAFRYAPAVGWLFAPAAWLSWPALVAVYLSLSAVALVALLGRRAPLFVLAFPPILLELLNGNVHIFMALAVWAGLRWPGAWAFIFLTKVTPGIGTLWFAGRRDWRGLAVALGVTGVIVAVGWAIAPGQWTEWIRTMTIAAGATDSPGVPPLMLRLPVAAALAWWAGRTGRAWVVPVAVFMALPVLWIQGLAILTASFPLYWERARWKSTSPAGAVRRPAPARPTAEVPA